MKKTKWYPAGIDPVLEGFYERDWSAVLGDSFAAGEPDYWDGRGWYYGTSSGTIFKESGYVSNDKPWRGLSEPPHAE
jgi:hypothetical protein